MERNLIAWNYVNVVTIALMGAGTWAVLFLAKQMFMRAGYGNGGG